MIRKLLPVLLVLVSPLMANGQIVSQQLDVLTQWSFETSLDLLPLYGFSDCYDREFVVVVHDPSLEFPELKVTDSLRHLDSYVQEEASNIQHWSTGKYKNQFCIMTDSPTGILLTLNLSAVLNTINLQEIKLEGTSGPYMLRVLPESRIMYVCGIAAAGLQFFDLSKDRSQPHFLNASGLKNIC